ncbi:hypothetical protein MRB53_039998 [Persea americana]|nr:hypothetical protein MRB53_039998 [Persea americana]
MSISLPTARWLAPASFIYNILAQTYGLLSTPNMLDIHNANISFFSPAPFLIGPFFFTHQVIQASMALLPPPSKCSTAERGQEARVNVPLRSFPGPRKCVYRTWMFFWNAERLGLADGFVAVNTIAQAYYVALGLETMNRAGRKQCAHASRGEDVSWPQYPRCLA